MVGLGVGLEMGGVVRETSLESHTQVGEVPRYNADLS